MALRRLLQNIEHNRFAIIAIFVIQAGHPGDGVCNYPYRILCVEWVLALYLIPKRGIELTDQEMTC